MKKEWKSWWGFFLLGFFMFSFMLTSCRTKKVIEYRDSIVTQYINKIEKDTLIQNIHDSSYVETIQRGDTIFVTKYKERIAYKDRVVIRTDTCYKDKIINHVKYETKEVKYVPTIYKCALGLCILLLIAIIYKITKWILQRRG